MLPQVLQRHPGARFRIRERACIECRDATTRSLLRLCRRCFVNRMVAAEARDLRRALPRDRYAAMKHALAVATMLLLPLGGADEPTDADIEWALERLARLLDRKEA